MSKAVLPSRMNLANFKIR
jgi:V-type H+-transporting ATPase subunit D